MLGPTAEYWELDTVRKGNCWRMSSDFTLQQTMGELRAAERLSLNATVPPAEVPGVKIEKLLGQGAFGQVWKGRDLNTGREVAIKFYLHRGGVNWSLLGREVKHLVNMSTGRYIVQVLTVGWEAEPPYYVMEFLENGSLEELVRQRGRLTVAESIAIFRQIAEGLNFAHGKGVLHCDLKPANVLLDHDWRPRLADFGQSRMSHEQSPSLGTLFYMAPEQADLAASADASWDVYALGAILHTMLVGSPPYRSPNVVEKLDTAASLPERLERYRSAIYESPAPRSHYKLSRADKALCQIVDRCLAKQPANRYANVQQVLEAVARREESRIRRPLYLLGIVGPLLLLTMMMVFFLRGISIAKQESLVRVQEWALKSNQFAAKFAASTLEAEIADLFRMVDAESGREQLRQLLAEASNVGAVHLQQFAKEPQPAATTQLLSVPSVKQLNAYLSGRLREILQANSTGGKSDIYSSLLVLDAQGNNLAIDYFDPEEAKSSSPIGKNYAYRTYFNGLQEDLPQGQTAHAVRNARLSSVFRSTTTGKWKVAVSSPVWRESSDAETESAPLGVLVLTINLGDFHLLMDASYQQADDRLLVFVDGRQGMEGILLQHPLLREREKLASRNRLDDAISNPPKIDPAQLKNLREEGMVDYRDPAAEEIDGQAYAGQWIAAMQEVHLPTNDGVRQGDRFKTDLWVLVQELSNKVREPVEHLGGRLKNEGLVGLGLVILVICIPWYFVFRMNQVHEQTPPVAQGSNGVNYAGLKATEDLE